jgi:alkylhydroperoxidase family enzyme
LNFERSSRYSERQKAALLLTSMIIWDPDGVDDALWARLREHFTEEELLELAYLSAYAFGGQRVIKTLGIGHGEVLNRTSLGLAPDVAAAVAPHEEAGP